MSSEEGRRTLHAIIDSLPEPDWDIDVHEHWQILEDAIHDGLKQHFPEKQRKKRIDIFSQRTRSFLDKRKHAKRILELHDDYQITSMIHWWPDATMAMVKARSPMIFRTAASELRKSIKQDKADFIDQVVLQADSTKGSDIYQALKPLRIGGFFINIEKPKEHRKKWKFGPKIKKTLKKKPKFGPKTKNIEKNKNLDQKPKKNIEKTKKTIFQNSPDLQPNPRVLRYWFFLFFCFFWFSRCFLVFGPNFCFFRCFFGFWSKFLFFHGFFCFWSEFLFFSSVLVFAPNFCFFKVSWVFIFKLL